MRKIISSIVVVALMLASLTMVSFAEETNVYFGTPVIDGDTATVEIFLKLTDGMLDLGESGSPLTGIGTLEVGYTITGAVAKATTVGNTALTGIDLEPHSETKIAYSNAGTQYAPTPLYDTEFSIGIITLEREAGAAKGKIEVGAADDWSVYIADNDGNCYGLTSTPLEFNWEEEVVVLPTVDGGIATNYTNKTTNELTILSHATKENTTYTSVPVFEGTVDATSFALKAVYTDSEAAVNGAIKDLGTVNLKNFTGTGTYTFRAAIVGVPSDVVIDGLYIVK